MKDKIFIDSNIFLYAFNSDGSKKQQTASNIILQENANSFMSVQVINEVSNNMLKKLDFTNSEIREFIEDSYKRFFVINFSKDIFHKASEIRDNYKISYYDSLIVASALSVGCTILYSEDMQNRLIVDNQVTIINPFSWYNITNSPLKNSARFTR